MSAQVIRAEPLEQFVNTLVTRMGADTDIADEVAAHLVRANLSGHDSHGVIRIPQYLQQADQGELLPAARPEIITDSGAGAVVDARRGFGQFSTAFALDWATRRARTNGLAAVTIRHSMHTGRLGEYTERTAAAGFIGIVTAGAVGANVGAMGMPGARGRFFGTNPWSLGFPGSNPVVFDGSTSTVAEGKVRLARDTGATLPPGCLTDPAGNVSQNPADLYEGGALLPLGGETAGHKGYGFALASALLGGLAMANDPEPTLLGASIASDGDPRGRAAGIFLVVIDPGLFGSEDDYRSLIDEASTGLKRAPAISAQSAPLIPGEPEISLRDKRQREGISLPMPIWQQLLQIAERFDLQPDLG